MKTETMLDESGAPILSILLGHHDVDTFNHAFIREGWEADPWPEDYISHEYWIKKLDGSWECSHKENPLAVPVTVAGWMGPQEEKSLGPRPDLH